MCCDQDVPTGYVYFIAAPSTGKVKIGWAKNPKHRLYCLQTGSPVPLEMMRIMPGVKADENLLHEQFAWCREVGEWFRLEPELDVMIDRLPRKPWQVMIGDLQDPTEWMVQEWAEYVAALAAGLPPPPLLDGE